MASLINIINALEPFFEEISSLLKDNGIHAYLKRREKNDLTITAITATQPLSAVMDEHYDSLYLTVEKYEPEKYSSFYDDNFFHYAIEVLGGRSTAPELENISLRIISKTPDPRIKSFFNKLDRYLKKSSDYGMGVGPGTSSFHKRVFYKKDAVKNRMLWFDFKRKIQPIIVI